MRTVFDFEQQSESRSYTIAGLFAGIGGLD